MKAIKYNLKKYKTFVIVFFSISTILILGFLGLYRCPLRYFFGISCPFCGMTRAIISVLTFKFNQSFYYHALWPVVVFGCPIYILFIHSNKNITKKQKDILLIIIGLLFFIYYIIRIFNNSPIVQFDFSQSFIYKIFSSLF